MIVGGSYIAMEFAEIRHGLGVDTTLCYKGEKLLQWFDEDIREFVVKEIKKGINILFNTQIDTIKKEIKVI